MKEPDDTDSAKEVYLLTLEAMKSLARTDNVTDDELHSLGRAITGLGALTLQYPQTAKQMIYIINNIMAQIVMHEEKDFTDETAMKYVQLVINALAMSNSAESGTIRN